MSKKADRIKFVKEVEKIILEKGGVRAEIKIDDEYEGNIIKTFILPTIPAKNDVLTIRLYPESDHKIVYSVFMKYSNLQKHNFHAIQHKGEDVIVVIDLFEEFLNDAINNSPLS